MALASNRNTLVIRVILSISFLSIIVLTNCNNSIFSSVSGSPGTFTNKKVGYSIDYPSGWSAFELPNGQHGEEEVTGILVMKAQDSPNVYIRQIQTGNPSMAEAIKWGELRVEKQYEEIGIFQFDEVEYFVLNGKEIAKRTYTVSFLDRDALLKKQDVYIVIDNKAFVITFSSTTTEFDNQIEVFNEMITSFEVTETP